MLTYIEQLKLEIEALKQLKEDLGLDEYEEMELGELIEELREKEHYQYLIDNDIEF